MPPDALWHVVQSPPLARRGPLGYRPCRLLLRLDAEDSVDTSGRKLLSAHRFGFERGKGARALGGRLTAKGRYAATLRANADAGGREKENLKCMRTCMHACIQYCFLWVGAKL